MWVYRGIDMKLHPFKGIPSVIGRLACPKFKPVGEHSVNKHRQAARLQVELHATVNSVFT
jgi:hypothetical protein